jgi:hypothetical protein
VVDDGDFLTPCPPCRPSARFTSLIVYHLLLLAQSTNLKAKVFLVVALVSGDFPRRLGADRRKLPKTPFFRRFDIRA